MKNILDDAFSFGIFSLNFNGGEPFCRRDFLEIASYAKDMGFDIHCNTNATLITVQNIKRIAELFPAICTSIHGSTSEKHDSIVCRKGALLETINAIKLLQEKDVYIAVNVTLSKKNIDDIEDILIFLDRLQIRTLLLTRVLTSDKKFALSNEQFFNAVEKLQQYQDIHNCFARIAFPQPFPVCRCNSQTVRNFILEHNIPCTAGLMTVRITPFGDVTPCPVLDSPVLGNVKHDAFSAIWQRFQETGWHKKTLLGDNCFSCNYLLGCGGGCLPQTDDGFLIKTK